MLFPPSEWGMLALPVAFPPKALPGAKLCLWGEREPTQGVGGMEQECFAVPGTDVPPLALGPREMGQEGNTDRPKILCIHQPLFSLPRSSQVWRGLFRSEMIRQ